MRAFKNVKGSDARCPSINFLFYGLVQRANFICKMGRRGALSQAEKSKIIQRLPDNISTLEISKELDRDHRTIKKFVTNPKLCNGHSDKGKIRKKAPVCIEP